MVLIVAKMIVVIFRILYSRYINQYKPDKYTKKSAIFIWRQMVELEA